MQHDFWHDAWSNSAARSAEPGWQQKEVNPHLTKHWKSSGAIAGEAVFVPLCGRSHDMRWLHDYGHHVIGIDLSVSALEEFCKQQSIDATCERDGDLTVFRAPGFTLYAGDFFKLQASHISQVSRVFDRAALIALPPEMRKPYAQHLRSILPGGSEIFLITIAYDQSQMNGPPFSVPETEVLDHYSDGFEIEVMQSASGPDQLGNLEQRGLKTLTEACFLLRPKVPSET